MPDPAIVALVAGVSKLSLQPLELAIEPWAVGVGRNHAPVPGMWFYRALASDGPKQVEAQMVTLAVIVRGRKRVVFDDVDLSYGPGSFLFVTGERIYTSTIEDASPDQPYLSMAMELPPELIAEVAVALTAHGPNAALPPQEDAPASIGEVTAPLFDILRRLVRQLEDPVERDLVWPLTQRELLIHLLRADEGAMLRRAVASDDERIRRARAYIEAHLVERLTVDQLARHAAMSPSHFAHRFREVVRMSPMQYAKHVRLQRARLRMVSEGLGAAEAGASVGYASSSHFTRDFKGYFGEPPAAHAHRVRRRLIG